MLPSYPSAPFVGVPVVGVSEFFSLYQKDFLQLTEKARAGLAALPSAAAQSTHEIGSLLQQAENCLRQMEVEVRSLPSPSSYSYQVQRYRSDFAQLSSSWQRHQTQLQRAAVLQPNNAPSMSASPRQPLEEATLSLHESSARLEGSRKLAVETEDLGLSIMGELRGQRTSVIRSTQMAAEANANIETSGQVLRGMRRRHLVNRLLLYGSVLLLTLAILLIVYVKLTRK
eukprot:GHVS01095303.1.p1 GENE.GHVS01095303.1~~GHVS01095303.1.p1  ORF type:complete len:228 (+),score=32.42 GHVS01095303.1:179-862(+)